MIVTLVPDVLFSSKIGQVAKQLGKEVRNAKSVEEFREHVLIGKPDLVILDLNAKGLDPLAAVRFLREYDETNFGSEPVRAVGFFSHVDTATQEAAQRAGLKVVMPRSEFSKRLAQILKGDSAEAGIGKLTLLVFGSIVAAAVYAAYNILPFYYYFYELQNQMEQLIKVASTETDREIRQKLWAHVKYMQIPAQPENLRIEREGNTMRISLPYDEVFYLTWRGKDYTLYTFNFDAYAEGQF